ncbi:MAG: serine/threonine-protein kinase, partial [Planctomycetota bacterium]|nr:serine/threonine-protein kinase [Planctomycetota bacterium]
GGFGEVYYALSDGGKEVALKLLQDNADVELRGIAQCLNLKHANLLSIFDVRQSGAGEQFVVMEYVTGRTLGEVIAEKPNGIELEYVEEMLMQLAAGTEYLHERGIVHRDLKPANIYLENGTIKIGDVGLAKFISESHRSAQTQSVGTVYYMAPEIAHGRYGREVDVYAIGVMLYEMLTGKVPFDGESTGEILMKQLSAEPDLSMLPAAIRPVLERALAKDPEKRTSTAGQLSQEFSAALHGVTAAIPSKTTPMQAIYQDGPVRGDGRRSADNPKPVQNHASLERHWKEPSAWIVGGGAMLFILLSPIIGAIGIPLLLLASPFLFLAAIAAVIYGLSRFVIRTFFTDTTDEQGIQNGGANRGIRLNSRYVRYESAHSERQLGTLDRVAESTGSMAVAGLCSAVIAFAMFAMGTVLKTPTEATLFAIVTTLVAWAAILPAKMWEGRGADGSLRRVVTGILGVFVGVAAFAADKSLMVDLPVSGFDGKIAHLIAQHDELPTSLSYGDASRLVGYVVFFSALLLIRRWWYHVDSFRPHRIRVMSVFWTGVAAWLLSLVTHFPVEWAVLWGIATSTAAQLAAVWVHPEQRSTLDT